MTLEWLLLIAGLAGFAMLVINAGALADRPRRGTAWSPSRRIWLALSIAPLLVAVGALINLFE
jgi:hypothetical protein